MMKIINILFLLVIFSTTSYAVSKERTIHIGTFDAPPLVFNENGETKGLYIDIIKEIAKKENWKLKFEHMNWNQGLTKIKNEELDLWTSTMFSVERDKYLNYHQEALLVTWVQVYTYIDSKIHDIFDIENKKIAIMKSDRNAEIFKEYVDKLEIKCDLIVYQNYIQIFKDLNDKKIEAAVAASAPGNYYSLDYKIRSTNIILNPAGSFFVVPENINSDLLETINKYIVKWKNDKNSIYHNRLEYWLHRKAHEMKVIPKYIKVGITTLVIILLISLIVSLILKKIIDSKMKQLNDNKQALMKSEEFIRSVMDNLPIGVAVNSVDPSVDFSYMNDAFPKHYQTTRDELEKHDNFWDAVFEDEEYRKWISERVISDCDSGDPKKMHWEKVEIKKNGKIIAYINARNTPFESKNIMISTVVDVTRMVQMEQELIDNEKFLYTTNKLAKVGGWEVSLDLKTLKCTKEFYHIHEIDFDEEIIFEDFLDEFHAKNKNMVIQAMKDVINKKEKSFNVQLKLISRKTKKEKWINAVGSIETNDNGNVIKFGGATHDITELHSSILEKEKLTNQLQRAQKMEAIGTLAGGIAHDFNNILSGIFGYTQLAQTETKDNENATRYLNEVFKASSRATELVKQILTFSRIKDDDNAKQIFKLSTIVKEALKLIRSTVPTTIDIKQEVFCNALIYANPTQIHQVVMNLCTNAFHSMNKDGGVMTVRLKEVHIKDSNGTVPELNLKRGEYIQMSVSDTGSGISKKIQEKIFEPYFTTKKQNGIKGTGLGLAVVRGIVENNKGIINVYSEPDQGAIFNVYLPINKDDKSKKIETTEISECLDGSENIMIVDDEPSIVNLLEELFTKKGYCVHSFTDSSKAFEAFVKDRKAFDLLITDMTMPKMTGAELSQKMLVLRSDFPIILCTGYSEIVDEDASNSLRISKYLTKPVESFEMLKVARQILDSVKKK